MNLIRHKDHFTAAAGFIVGSGGVPAHALADLRLSDIPSCDSPWEQRLQDRLRAAPPAAPLADPVQMQVMPPQAGKPAKIKKTGLLDRPMTLRRHLRLKVLLFTPVILLAMTALADKYTGGRVMLHVVDAGVSTAEFAYRHLRAKFDLRDAVEWGVTLSRPLKFLHTDTVGLLAKNEAAIEAKSKFPGQPDKIKDVVLPAVLAADYKTFIANYALRNAITLRNYPKMPVSDRGRLLALGLLKDVHEAYAAASETADTPLSDRDILRLMAKRPDILRRLPADLRTGLVQLITEAFPRPAAPAPLQLQDWQKRSLEAAALAEMGPPISPEEQRRRDKAMADALAADAEARRPKTLAEMVEIQRRQRAQRQQQQSGTRPPATAAPARPRVVVAAPRLPQRAAGLQSGLRQKMNGVARPAAPSGWTVTWCKLKQEVWGTPMAKCIIS